MQDLDLVFIADPAEVQKCLIESKVHKTVVGISAPILGSGVFLTGVQDIIQTDSDYVIVLAGYDITGYILERNKIRLSDIRAVCPFKSEFKNPYLHEFTGERFFEVQ
jgi:hypothetical protein